MATEKRMIDATPIIDECKECSAIEWNKSVYTTWAEAEEDFMQRLLDAPIVDAVEVVRCKDCKKWKRHTEVDRERGECRRYQTTKHETGFCDRGERRTE